MEKYRKEIKHKSEIQEGVQLQEKSTGTKYKVVSMTDEKVKLLCFLEKHSLAKDGLFTFTKHQLVTNFDLILR